MMKLLKREYDPIRPYTILFHKPDYTCTLLNENFCLDSSKCYKFIFEDSYADGLEDGAYFKMSSQYASSSG
jgi:hypothetical protein